MSGPFGAGALQLYGGAGGFYSHTIGQSLRFEDGDSPRLSRTPSSAGNRRTWTFSCWVKRATNDIYLPLFNGANTASASHGTLIRFRSTDTTVTANSVEIIEYNSGSTTFEVASTAMLRDPSAWYNIVFSIDTTQSTSSDRVKIYINGALETADLGSYPSLNYQTYANNNTIQYVGAQQYAGSLNDYFDGYLAEVHLVDGTALDASSFGETKAGIWIPKKYSGSHGTNGFYLPFDDSSAIGDDESANTNDFTATNLAATDVVLDSPTNNFCTLNPLFTNAGTTQTFAEGNLKFTADSNYALANGTFAMRSGKWYWETLIQTQNFSNVGITRGTNTGGNSYVGYDANGNVFGFGYQSTIIYGASGDGTASGATLATGQTSYTTGDIIGCSFDADAGELKFYKNNTLVYTISSINEHDWMPANSGYGTSNVNVVNFGQDSSFANNKTTGSADASDDNGVGDFYYSPPSGFLALCSANLSDPDIDPAEDEEPADYFNTVLYAGNSSTNNVTGVGFQPDWVWLKNRSSASTAHRLYDSVRGPHKALFSTATNAEFDESSWGLDSFDSDGFTLLDDATNRLYFNQTGQNYVSWNWLAGGSAVSNTDGSITSSVSANTEAGFSVVSYTGNGSTNQTVGHGLGVALDALIIKPRSTTGNWFVWHRSVTSGNGKYLYLNLTNSLSGPAVTPVWDTANTSTQSSTSAFDISANTGVNGSGETFIAYCFHSVDGYSKVGSYTGNGSSNGSFIYTGFRPAFIIYKETGNTNNWIMLDNQRDPDNVVGGFLYPNLSSAEATGYTIVDFLSNGFKHRSTATSGNRSGGSYIYLAFAEQPFKYSNAR